MEVPKVNKTNEAYVEDLKSFDWTFYITLTFRSRIREEECQNRLFRFIYLVNRSIYGKRFRESQGKKGVIYFVSAERQPTSNNIHFHMILSFPNRHLTIAKKGYFRNCFERYSKKMIRQAWKESGCGDLDIEDFPTGNEIESTKVIGYCVKQATYGHLPYFKRLGQPVRKV